LASPTFTGTVSGIDKTMVGLTNVDNTSDANKPVSTATQTALNLKANLASPTFTGIPVAPTAAASTNSTQIATTEYVTTAISTSGSNFLPLAGGTLSGTLNGVMGDFSSNFKVSSLTINGSSVWDFGTNGTGFSLHQGGCCSRLTIDGNGRFGIGANYTPSYQLDVEGDGRFTSSVTATSFIRSGGTSSQFLKADGTVDSNIYATLSSPTFTGTVSGITKTMVGLGNVDNTTDLNKPVSTATNTALALKVDKVAGERLINAAEITKLSNQSGTNTGDQDLSSYATNTDLALKANLASPNFTGTPSLPTGTVGVTQTAGNNSTALATTAYVDSANSVNANLTGDVTSVGNSATIANDVVTSAKIIDETITNNDISSSAAISYSKLNLSDAITSSDLTTGSVATAKIADNAITTAKINTTGTTNGQVLTSTGDGTTPVWANPAAGAGQVIEDADEYVASASQIYFSLTHTPSANSKVKMYINGIRISNSAYSVSGSTLTYNPVNNGAYVLTLNDRIQFDYFH
jgi:hypothetical protein